MYPDKKVRDKRLSVLKIELENKISDAQTIEESINRIRAELKALEIIDALEESIK